MHSGEERALADFFPISLVTINPHAGHWVFLDNPEGMNRIFTEEMKEALQDHSNAQ